MLHPARYKQVDDAASMASSARLRAWSPVQPAGRSNHWQAPAVHDFITPILEAPFAQDQWSQRYLQSLGPLHDGTLITSIFHQLPHQVVTQAETFHFQNPGYAPIAFHATLASVVGQPQRLAIIAQILDAEDGLAGFWRKTFWRNEHHELECHFDMLKTRLDCQAIRGISKAITPYFDRLNQALGVTREFLEADWIGRLVWTNYYDVDETHFYIEDGCRLTTLEVLRRNFDRFLNWQHLRRSDLLLVTPDGKQPLTQLGQLKSPGDFARIEHRDGKLVDVEVLLDDPPRRVEKQSLPVGKAFMLADFTASSDNVVELIDGYYGERLSDRTMPYWFGVKHVDRPCPPSSDPYRVHHFERHGIVIVGAGLAGLTAAARLEDAGLKPVIYEAHPSRIGGRLHSLAFKRCAGQFFLGDQQLTQGGSATGARDQTLGIIEAGGEFIGHQHSALQTLAQELGLSLIKVKPALQQPHILVSPSPGEVLTLSDFAAQHQPLLDRIGNVWQRWQHDDLSLGDEALSLDRFFGRMAAPASFRSVVQGFIRAQFGADIHQVSLGDWFDMQPFNQQGRLTLFASNEFSYRMQGGLQQLPQALEQRLTQSVRMGHTLTELRSADGNHYVLDFHDPNGERLRVFAEFVLLTLPMNPLKRDIVFDLPVTDGRALSQISQLPMGNNAKTIAFFRQPFWRSRVPDAFFYLSAPHFTLWEPAMEMDAAATGLYPIAVYTGGETAQAAREPDALIEQVLAHLENAFPTMRQNFVAAMQPIHWPSAPYAQGSYTGWDADAADFDCLHMHHGPLSHSHLTLAGEALSRQFRGFAEGAVETGLKAANRMIQLHCPCPRC